jgi:hypothetical protein
VEFKFEKLTTLQINKPQDPERPLVTNARVDKVKRVLNENAERFQLGTQIVRFYATFTDGELRRFEIIEVE